MWTKMLKLLNSRGRRDLWSILTLYTTLATPQKSGNGEKQFHATSAHLHIISSFHQACILIGIDITVPMSSACQRHVTKPGKQVSQEGIRQQVAVQCKMAAHWDGQKWMDGFFGFIFRHVIKTPFRRVVAHKIHYCKESFWIDFHFNEGVGGLHLGLALSL